jgi:hypothetical protein
MGIESVVNVQIDRLTKLPTRKGFGVPLILDINSVMSSKVMTFEDPEDMIAAGFTTSDEAYKCAVSLMSQNPKPETFKVGKRLANVAQIVTVTPDIQGTFTYTVTINGTVHTYLSDSDATAAEIVAGLSAAINGGAQATKVTASGTTTLIITSDTAGQGFSYSVGASLTAVLTAANVGPDTELAAIIEQDDDWYFLLTTDRSELALFQLAAAIEAKVKLFGFDTNEANSRDLLPATDTTSIFARMKAAGYDRTFGVWSADLAHYPVAAWIGKCAPRDPGSFTFKFKNVAGVTADALTPTQKSNILRKESGPAKNSNTYTVVGGIANFEEGSVFSGEFIDIIHGTDWIQARMQENVYFLLTSEDKVPFDNGGIEAVVLRIEDILKQAVDRRILRGGDQAPKVTAPDITEVTQADRGNRFLEGIEFEGFYAGAVHKVKIKGRLTV